MESNRENVIYQLEKTAEFLQKYGFGGFEAIRCAIALLKEQEEIVHCKDCKWWNPDDCDSCNLRMGMYNVLSGFYCADGKRRDDDA